MRGLRLAAVSQAAATIGFPGWVTSAVWPSGPNATEQNTTEFVSSQRKTIFARELREEEENDRAHGPGRFPLGIFIVKP